MSVSSVCGGEGHCYSPVFDLLRHGQESLLDVGRVLCGCLEEGDTELVGEGLGTRGLQGGESDIHRV